MGAKIDQPLVRRQEGVLYSGNSGSTFKLIYNFFYNYIEFANKT
jgi:hypothetical protein